MSTRAWLGTISVWASSALLSSLAVAGPGESVPPDAVISAANHSRGAPLPERIDAVSASMLGNPYLNDPLGEGAGTDTDPLVRYDAFDCLTYVEEVLALSMSPDPAHAADIRLALRYGDAGHTYADRNHFMELQWIPGAIRDGWVKDTTAEYGPTTRLEREVTEATWRAWRSRAKFALSDDQLPLGTMALDVLELDDAIAAAARIRPGSILLTVRADRTWSPIWISHLGLVVSADTPTVRHATKMGKGSTRDHGLVWYLNHLKTYTKWPAAGVAILEPMEYGPRLSRLGGVSRDDVVGFED